MSKKVIAAIIIIAFFVFLPTLSTYFSQDDWVFLSHVYKKPFFNIFQYHAESFYRPIGQELFFWIGTKLFGLDASGFHFLGFLIHATNIFLLWKLLRPSKKTNTAILLIFFYAIHPIHFATLNWLTQIDIEIATLFSLLAIHLWEKTLVALISFVAALLSHETSIAVPIFIYFVLKGQSLKFQGLSSIRSSIKFVLFLTLGAFALVSKYFANPFPFRSDYALRFNVFSVASTIKWYIFRSLFLPEGIRLLPIWTQIFSVVSFVSIILFFRKTLLRPLLIFSIGLLPVLLLSSHSFSVYAVIPLVFLVLELSRNLKITSWPVLAIPALLLVTSSISTIWFLAPSHWTTTRGMIARNSSQRYLEASDSEKEQLKKLSLDSSKNPEVYFSTMQGRQFAVLDKGHHRGVFDFLFYRGNDLTTQFLPDAIFFKESILSGKFPVWNPWIFAGMPYLLDPQNFLWYPPNYLLLLIPLELGFLILLIGHLALAGYFMKKLLGELPVWSWWLGIFLYVASPKLVSHLEEGNWSLAIAALWLPALYWAITNRRFWWITTTLSALIMNNLNIGYYSILFTALYFAFMKRTVLEYSRTVLKILLFVSLLTIPRWLPLAFYGNQTVRASLAEASLPFWSWTKIVKSLFFPLGYVHPILQNEEILYVGVIPIVLFVISVFKGRSLRTQGPSLRNFWLAWILFLAVVAINNKTPLFLLIQLLPGFSLLRITTRPWIFISLFIALFLPTVLARFSKKSKILAALAAFGILGEFGCFGYKIFVRRTVPQDPLPLRFYQEISKSGIPVRAYCTDGCLDRLTAQEHGIALLGGNNPIQLTEFIRYLEKAGGYQEPAYHPILPPYTVFSLKPQPSAGVLGQTATHYVVSPYELSDKQLTKIDQQGAYRLYENEASIMGFRDHYFSLAISK